MMNVDLKAYTTGQKWVVPRGLLDTRECFMKQTSRQMLENVS